MILLLIIASFGAYYLGKNNHSADNGQTNTQTPTSNPTPTNTQTPTSNPTHTHVPFDFTISLIALTSGTVMQGDSIQIIVNIAWLSGPYDNVTLSGDGGSSGIQCSFNPSIHTPNFTSALTMSVPASTPTNPYPVIVTATGGNITHTISYTVSVLSAYVTVSGTIFRPMSSPTQIQFVDQQTGLTYTESVTGNSYSISLQNEHTYDVTCSWIDVFERGTSSCGSLYVYAPAGHATMSQSFSVR